MLGDDVYEVEGDVEQAVVVDAYNLEDDVGQAVIVHLDSSTRPLSATTGAQRCESRSTTRLGTRHCYFEGLKVGRSQRPLRQVIGTVAAEIDGT